MEKRLIKLYDESELGLAKKKRAAAHVIACVIAAVTLAFCIVCVIKAGKTYSTKLLITAITGSVIGSWIVLSLRIFLIDPLESAVKHLITMLTEESEQTEGVFELKPKVYDIKKGVSLLRVSVLTNDGRQEMLSLYEKKRKLFDAEKARRVYSVMGFICAYEVEYENN